MRMLALPIDNPFFAAQIVLAAAIAKTGAEALLLGPERNCPNSDEMLGSNSSSIPPLFACSRRRVSSRRPTNSFAGAF